MIAIKYQTDINENIFPYLQEYNRAIRMAYSYSRKCRTIKLSDIEKHVKTYTWLYLDATLIKMAVNEAKALFGKEKVVFGSKIIFNKLKYKKSIDKKAWINSRSSSMLLRGDKRAKGNRKAKLDLDNDQILFKPEKGIEFKICIKHLSKQKKNELKILQNLCENKQAYFSLCITRNSVSILFDENILSKKTCDQKPQRVLAIDLNPNYIGLVICDKDVVLHKEIIDFKTLNEKDIANNKKKYEKYQAIKHIMSLARHWHVEAISSEKLSMPNKEHNRGKTFNRLVNNTWHKNLLIGSIKKHCVLNKIKHIEVIAAYSSVVGCMQYEEIDSIAAALELNNRAQSVLSGKRYIIKPIFVKDIQLTTRWKKMLIDWSKNDNVFDNFADLYNFLKKSKISYRILFTKDVFCNSLRLNSCKSFVEIHNFT